MGQPDEEVRGGAGDNDLGPEEKTGLDPTIWESFGCG